MEFDYSPRCKELQAKFPHNKVFSDRCPEPGEIN